MEAKNTVFMPVKVLHHPHVIEPWVVAQRARDPERFPVETQPVQVGEVPELGLRRRADPSRSQAAARRKKLGHHSEAPLQFFVQINVPRKGEPENPEPGRRPVHTELGCDVKAQISIQWIVRRQMPKIPEMQHFSPKSVSGKARRGPSETEIGFMTGCRLYLTPSNSGTQKVILTHGNVFQKFSMKPPVF